MPTRRDLLKTALATPVATSLHATTRRANAASREKLPVAAVVTEYRNNSHADVICGKILEGWNQDGGAGPDLKLVSLYTDQVPKGDLSRALQTKHGFRICKTIDDAVTFGSGDVQVAGVLSIGEHGNYPNTEDTNQKMYPRRRLFDGIADAFRRCGSVVPVFNDKHLSYRWSDAKHMYDTAQQMRIPMMAGSSLPVTWRKPSVELPMGCEIEAALSIGYGGLESYGFHALEAHQCMIERRRDAEAGVAAVQAVRGDAIWKAEREGRWSRELFDAALASTPGVPEGKREERVNKGATFYLLDHRDGLKSAVAMANGLARHFAVAVKLRGEREPLVSWFQLQDEKPYGHFAFLTHAIEEMIHGGTPSYPVERTLLTTGVLDAAMHSVAQNGKRIATPQLDVAYKPMEWPFANHPRSQPLVKMG